MCRVAICAITFRRPAGLARLLDGLAALRFEHPEPAVEVIVVDNDPAASARSICEERQAAFRWPLRYGVEAEPGISQARNRAVALALPDAAFIAFIDDDEVPEPAWLAELLAAAGRTHADIVTGPVLPFFPEGVPEWIARGKFFERARHPDGVMLSVAATNNVLIHQRVFERLHPWFDPRFGLSGSGDTLFFLRARQAGFRIAWADRSEVVEWVPASRATASWLLRRGFRGGNGYTRCVLTLDAGLGVRLVRAAKGMLRVGQGLLALPAGLARGRHVWMKHSLRVAQGLGSIAGAFGYAFPEYRRAGERPIQRKAEYSGNAAQPPGHRLFP